MTVNSRPGCGRSSEGFLGRESSGGTSVPRSYPQTSADMSSGPLQPHSQPSFLQVYLHPWDAGSPDTVRHHGDIQLFRQAFSCQWAGEKGFNVGGQDWGGGWAPNPHSALFGCQFDFGAWMPNLPPSMQLPPPTSKGQASLEGFLATSHQSMPRVMWSLPSGC